MKKQLFIFALAAMFLFSVVGTTAAKGIEIGSKLDDFVLKDTRSKEHSIRSLKGENGTLIIFLSAQCPVVEIYNDRINALAAEYKAKGINFVGLYSNATECLNWVKHHSRKEYKFKTLIDENNVIADRFGAQFTPEVYYFNKDDVLDYHGAIDNDRSGQNIENEYLKTAFNSKLAGKKIETQETRAFGCSIKRVKTDK